MIIMSKNLLLDINELHLYNPGNNKEVTEYYVDIIRSSFQKLNIKVKNIESIDTSKKHRENGLVITNLSDVKLAKKAKYKKIICWIQGVGPEEYLLCSGNKLMYCALSLLEMFRLKKCDFLLFCSDKMKNHYEHKYRLHFQNYYVMPCFNEEIHYDEIVKKDYSENVFVYAGSMAKWQCFEETLEVYKKIEESIPFSKLQVYVKDIEMAKKIIKKKEINNYTVDYVSPEELKKRLKKAKYGFCIRDNIVVNQVATPTKLSNYISNGVIPIYSKCIDSFHDVAKQSKYCIGIKDKSEIDKMFSNYKNISGEDVAKDYECNFGKYYSANYHVQKLVQAIKQNN